MRRVAILRRNGNEIQKVFQDEEAARAWVQTAWKEGDEFVCIEDEILNLLRLAIRESKQKSLLTLEDIALLRQMKIVL